jgi:redox-sensing transcriptional repressor
MAATPQKRPQRALCGIFNCTDCERHSAGNCSGCLAANLARRHRSQPTCVIYNCVREQKLESCWSCVQADCPLIEGKQPHCVAQDDTGKAGERLQKHIDWLIARRAGQAQPTTRSATGGSRLARARWYLTALEEMCLRGVRQVSSYDLAQATGVKSALVRRDLSCMGHLGTPSLGYEVALLRDAIADYFGVRSIAYWIGAERLLAQSFLAAQFAACSCPLAGVFDPDDRYIGKSVAGLKVKPLSELHATANPKGITVAILALPAAQAQAALEALADAGIRAVLSLVAAPLSAPPNMLIQQADLPSQLFTLLARCR